MPKLLRGMHDNLNVMVGDHTSRTMPETLTSQTRMPTVPATEEATVDCVAFFLRGGERWQEFSKEKHI